jgi:galactokinase
MSLEEAFYTTYGQAAGYCASAPGRVNLLGEHVDYNDGPVLPAAIDRRVTLLAQPDPRRMVTLQALDLGETSRFSLDNLEAKRDLDGRPLPHWCLYPAGVAWALRQSGYSASGLQGVFNSTIPVGSGLSSSAAIQVVFAVLWRELGGWSIGPMELAQICLRAEREYVGLSCGLMDQFASLCGVEGHALYFDTRSLTWEALALPQDTAIVVADSGVRRSLTESGYNERQEECEQALGLLQQWLPRMRSLRDISTTEFAAYSDRLPPALRMRAEHVVKEIARVQSARSALLRADRQAFAALMYAGHASLRDLYQVSTPELDSLVALARRLPGCCGARLTGAGFGGCTVNLVQQASLEEFQHGLAAGYREACGREADVFACQAAAGARCERMGD